MLSLADAQSALSVVVEYINQPVEPCQPISDSCPASAFQPHAYDTTATVHLPAQSSAWNFTVTYHQRMAPSIPDGAVLFIGDSHIQGMCVSSLGVAHVNLGIGGDTSRGVINRTRLYEPLERTGAVVLMIGVNDFYAEGPYWNGNMKLMIDKLLSHFAGGPLIVVPLLPIAQSIQSGYLTAANISLINNYWSLKANLLPNVQLLNVDDFAQPDGYIDPSMTIDGLHLSGSGQTRLLDKIRTALGALL